MLDFTLRRNTYQLLPAELEMLELHPPISKDDWAKARYEAYKQNIKGHLILGQFDRCAYCRNILEADGKYEPLDHIVPQSFQAKWIFEVKNLILTCDSCNNLKSKEQTLNDGYDDAADLPDESKAYKLFNPHFDLWSEHLDFENDIFIVAVKNSKGKETIRICQLFRYNVIINRAKELKIGNKTPIEQMMYRLVKLKTTDPLYEDIVNHLAQATRYFIKRMQDNPDFD